MNDERIYPKPCPKCKGRRWQTKIKGQRFECRNCGYTRDHKEGDDKL